MKKVDCDKRHMLTAALPWAELGNTLHVTGTCQERVTITTDRLTTNGDGSAVLDGGGTQPLIPFHGVITVDGAHGIGVTVFTIQNGPNGIVAMKGAAIAVINVTVQDNVQGIIVMTTPRPNSQNNELGMNVFTTSSSILRGAIIMRHIWPSGLAHRNRTGASKKAHLRQA